MRVLIRLYLFTSHTSSIPLEVSPRQADCFSHQSKSNRRQERIRETTATTCIKKIHRKKMENNNNNNFNMIGIVIPLFLLWSSFIGFQISLGLAYLFVRRECHSNLTVMIGPPWIVGIILPLLFGYSWNGVFGAILVVSITVILPHVFCICWHVQNNPDLRSARGRGRRGGGCCCWRYCFGGVDGDGNGSASTTNFPTSGTTRTTGIALSGTTNNNYNSNTAATTMNNNNDKKEKLPLLIYKKVLLKNNQNDNNNKRKEQSKNTEEQNSFRFNNPKSDIYISTNNNNIKNKKSDADKKDTKKDTQNEQEKSNDDTQQQNVELSNSSILVIPPGGGEGEGREDSDNVTSSFAGATSTAYCSDEKDLSSAANTTNNNSVQTSLLCAICLEDYKVGDDIAWSCNPKCHHVFHKDCVLEFLLKSNREECPMCRNTYRYDDPEAGANGSGADSGAGRR